MGNCAKVIMVQGTGSSVGKSVIVTALCRIFLRSGFRVAPFKAQNMSLNSFVTRDGGEIGRAQAVQAQASRIEPTVDMNPVLLKPVADTKSQIIIQGKAVANMSFKERNRKEMLKRVLESFGRLSGQYDVVVIEGAGSPAEINLKRYDIVNMKIAKLVDAPVILVSDIDRGGAFASIVGTMELLKTEERKRIKGFMINKFRGDKTLLKSGMNFLQSKTRRKVLGVIPYFTNIRIPDEDSVALEHKKQKIGNGKKIIKIDVIRLPYVSNFTDFDLLENEPDVRLRYIDDVKKLNEADVIIIPGTKNTIKDLTWLKKSGIAKEIVAILKHKLPPMLIGICGGYQMLGNVIWDVHNVESRQKEVEGLGLLQIITHFEPEKMLSQVSARELETGIEVNGYEIHHGRTTNLKPVTPVFAINGRKGFDGAKLKDGTVWGTYIHGVFDNDDFRRKLINSIRAKKGWEALATPSHFRQDKEFDKLADLVQENININFLYKILLKQI